MPLKGNKHLEKTIRARCCCSNASFVTVTLMDCTELLESFQLEKQIKLASEDLLISKPCVKGLLPNLQIGFLFLAKKQSEAA